MDIYRKFLLTILPLMYFFVLTAVGATYYFYSHSLTDLAEVWLESRLTEAVRTAKEHEGVLHNYGLQNMPASVKLSQSETVTSMRSIEVGKQGYIWVIDSQGMIVMHPDQALVGQDVSHELWFQEIQEQSQGRITHTLQQERSLAVYAYFPPWEWYILTSSPESEVYGPVKQMVVSIIVVLLVVFITGSVLPIFIIHSLTEPIRQIVHLVQQVSKGDFSDTGENLDLSRKDEVGIMINAVVQMKQKIREVLQETEALIQTVHEGNLKRRGAADFFEGGWRDLVVGVNKVIDAFVAPITVTAHSLERISRGNIPEKITDEYRGDFNEMKNNLNLLIDSMHETTRITDEIARGNLRVDVSERSEDDRLMKAFQGMAAYLGEMASLSTAIAAGDLYQDIQPKSKDDVLGNAFHTMAVQLNENFEKIQREITERQRAEDALAQERNLLRTLIENMPDLIYVKDLNSRFLIANKAMAYSMRVATSDELLGKTDFDFHPPDMAERYRADEQAILDSGQPLINREEPIVKPEAGITNWLLSTKVPFRDNQGKIAGLVGINRDITDRKRAEEELRQHQDHLEELVKERTAEVQAANRALKQSLETLKLAQDQLVQAKKMAALGGLVAGIAHEINTPLGIGVTAASHLEHKTRTLAERYKESRMTRSDLEKYLSTALESANMILRNLQRAAEQIQSFKQVAVDQTSSEQRWFKLKAYIADLLLSLHPKLKRTMHMVTVQCPEDLEILSYPGAFSQIITNFIMNSLTHGFEATDQGEMAIEISREGERLRICYRDNGRGMTPEEQSRAFEPFYTTTRGQGGTGLGLYIVYNLVTQKLKGTIECESTPGIGTTFAIQIPVGKDAKHSC